MLLTMHAITIVAIAFTRVPSVQSAETIVRVDRATKHVESRRRPPAIGYVRPDSCVRIAMERQRHTRKARNAESGF